MYRIFYVSGHRNPDADSIASAYALAALRKAQNPDSEYIPIDPGVFQERIAYLFQKFGLKTPQRRTDVYLRMRDLLVPATGIPAGTSLFSAVSILKKQGAQQLPIVDGKGRFIGMLSALALLSRLLYIDGDDGDGFAGRRIRSSIALMQTVLDAKMPAAFDAGTVDDFDVYVAAMRVENFEDHIPVKKNKNLVLIVGDRPEILWKAIDHRIRLLVVTGGRELPGGVIASAKLHGVSVLETKLDSATAIRRLKFSTPVELVDFSSKKTILLAMDDRVRDFRAKMMRSPDELFPVVDEEGRLVGLVFKKTLSEPPPHQLILVDHNEPEQRIPGAEELPVVEIVDHHRIGTIGTAQPIRFTGDVVGSTCTLVAKMFQEANVPLQPAVAGVLLGGLISDTLMLKSPTTTPLDREICARLEKCCGVPAKVLMEELLRIDSPLTKKSAKEVINGDRKDYTHGRFHFALSQIEESDFQLLRLRKTELEEGMREACASDKLNFFGLLVTDAARETSALLAVGDREILHSLPYELGNDGIFSLPGILSRKKQLLPQIATLLSDLSA